MIHNSKKNPLVLFFIHFLILLLPERKTLECWLVWLLSPQHLICYFLVCLLFGYSHQNPSDHLPILPRFLGIWNLLFRVLTLGNFSKVAEDSVILHSSSRYSWVSWVTTNITSHLWPTIFLLLSLCSVCNTYSLSATWRLMIRLRRDMNAHKCRLCGILHGAPHHKSQHKCKCTFCLSLIIML